MITKHYLQGYEEFSKFFSGEFDSNDQIVFVYFTGSKLPSGESWCPDCVKAWPVVEKELEKFPENCHFIVVEVGDRPTWKDPNCPFRKDPRTKLMVIPTLKRWNTHQKLEGDQCEKSDLLELIFGSEE
ncbi:thioredoxin domain-containing protein 17-like [Cylas formicarius]|uniref:thioredoxin domain-containing protein 17-like n=1 Tax=Cylas formicarius TaxID=197179 RepID=UPI00295888BF|nr:thioredoxin domain-containing protein 17-like [Cylas formicarius]